MARVTLLGLSNQMCTRKGENKAFLLSVLCGARVTASDIAEKHEEKQCLESVSHLNKLQERMKFLWQVVASHCGLFFARQCPGKTTQVPFSYYPKASCLSTWVCKCAISVCLKEGLKTPCPENLQVVNEGSPGALQARGGRMESRGGGLSIVSLVLV